VRQLLIAAEKSGLTARYGGDDTLLRLYMRKLLKPGWPGQLDEVERRYRRYAKRLLGRYIPNPSPANRFGARRGRTSGSA